MVLYDSEVYKKVKGRGPSHIALLVKIPGDFFAVTKRGISLPKSLRGRPRGHP